MFVCFFFLVFQIPDQVGDDGCLVVIAGLTGNLLSKVVNHGRRCVKVVAED